jgi:hypothetical protein
MWFMCLTNLKLKHFLFLVFCIFFLEEIKPSSQKDELGTAFSPEDLETARLNAWKQVNLYRKWHKSNMVSLAEKASLIYHLGINHLFILTYLFLVKHSFSK